LVFCPGWVDADGANVVWDEEFGCYYRVRDDHVEVVARPRDRQARIGLMRVVRELASVAASQAHAGRRPVLSPAQFARQLGAGIAPRAPFGAVVFPEIASDTSTWSLEPMTPAEDAHSTRPIHFPFRFHAAMSALRGTMPNRWWPRRRLCSHHWSCKTPLR